MRTALLVILVVLGACGPTPKPIGYFAQTRFPNICQQPTVIGVGDILEINVWDQKDLDTEATVRPDGTITMPLVGDIQAVGETPTALREKIKTSLAAFVKMGSAGNEVTVAVRSWRSYRFTIQGEVTHAGVFTADQYLTVADAMALAGGPSKFAKRNEMTLLRRDPKSGEIRRIPLDYDSIASGKRQDMNIYVLPGDTIWVP
jgi:polysaccharide export outer membrane protein